MTGQSDRLHVGVKRERACILLPRLTQKKHQKKRCTNLIKILIPSAHDPSAAVSDVLTWSPKNEDRDKGLQAGHLFGK